MRFRQRSLFVLLCFLLLLSAIYGQDAHWQIQEMERSRYLRMEKRFFSQLKQADQSDFDVTYYQIRLNINPVDKNISGSVTTKAIAKISGLREITLDFYGNMNVDSVFSNGVALSYNHDRTHHKLVITLDGKYGVGEIFAVTVYYHGQPMDVGGFHSFTFEEHQGVPIISTLSEPFGAPTWWPCKDNPADKADSVDIIITVPATLVVASNGILVSEVDNGDGTKTFFWAERYPITTYLVSLAISNYEVFSDYYYYPSPDSSREIDSMEVQYFVYPEDLEKAREDFNVTVDMIEYYSSIFGEYPFIKEKYGMAEFPWGGAMEHQTCTSYGQALIQGNHYYDWVIAHELAHQWFGNLITMKWWSHIWLNEGFASYAEALWAENVGGREAYHEYMNSLDRGIFPTSIFVYDSTNIRSLFDRTVYDKGAWVLHMLRHIIGDTSFFRAMMTYRENYMFGNATTEDFRKICEAEYGADLDWFFKQWIYGRYRPSYEYSWSEAVEGSDHVVTLTLNQVQTNTGVFKMPLDIVLSTESGDTTIVVWDSLKTQTFQFVLSEEVTDIKIDPEGWVLKVLQYAAGISDILNPPGVFSLSQNYPNPFNSETVIRYTLPYQGSVSLDICDLLGRKIRTLVDEIKPAGSYSVQWDGRNEEGENVSSGIYLYRIRAKAEGGGDFRTVRKMVLIR